MTRNVTLTAWGLLATLAATSLSPVLADGRRDHQQTDKNNARNIAIAGAAVAVYGLLSHNKTATVVGAAAGALGAGQYEKDRHQQSRDDDWRNGRRDDRNWNNGGWNRSSDRNWNNGDRNWNDSRGDRNTGGWDRDRDWDTRAGNGRQWNDADYHRQGGRDNQQWNRDNRNNSNQDCDRDSDARWNGNGRSHGR